MNSKKVSFGDRPRAYVGLTIDKFTYNIYNGSNYVNVNQNDLKIVQRNPGREYLLCSSTSDKYPHRDFDIVYVDGKWDCRHKNCRYSRDIKNCDEPKLGYYEKYWDYTETNFNKKLKDLPEDKYYDGTQLQELPEMYFYDPLKGELQLIPYDDENDKSKRCARRIWDSEKNRYKCTKYRCRDCYNCDTQTGTCKDTVLSKTWCKALTQNTGCNYDSFTDGYMGD